MIHDEAPDRIRVIVAAATGMIRSEVARAFDSDFEVACAADAPAAELAARAGVHALVVVADDLVNADAEELVQRVRLASADGYRVPAMWLNIHPDGSTLLVACQAGADDVARWPLEPDMFRARVRSLVRVSVLEASMGRAAERGDAGESEVREALSICTHMINNAVAGISGRAQLAVLTGAEDESGLVPVCLTEGRKVSLILNALHRLSEALAVRCPEAGDEEAVLALSVED